MKRGPSSRQAEVAAHQGRRAPPGVNPGMKFPFSGGRSETYWTEGPPAGAVRSGAGRQKQGAVTGIAPFVSLRRLLCQHRPHQRRQRRGGLLRMAKALEPPALLVVFISQRVGLGAAVLQRYKEKAPCKCRGPYIGIRQLPTLPGRRQPSTIGV